MVLGFTLLLAKISAVIAWFSAVFVKVFQALWDLVRDAVTWPFEQLLEICRATVTAIPVDPSLTTNLSAWGSLPADLINILGLLHLGTAITIIVAAIGVRTLLQLVPFTRLGS